MTLATATPDGRPSARMVLLKGVDERGLVFYTNQQSRKAGELAANARAALLFHWKSLRRQVRVEGRIEHATDAEADAYFATRARISRLGAWASDQSRPLPERAALEARLAEMEARYPGEDVPRPPHWSGYRVRAGELGVLAEHALSPARPHRVHPRRGGGGVGRRQVVSLRAATRPRRVRCPAGGQPEDARACSSTARNSSTRSR